MRQSADAPVALEACYLSEEKYEDLADESLRAELQGSLFSTLERKYGINLAHADEEVDATVADARLSELMAISRGTPLLRIRQVIYTTQDKPALYVLGLYLSGRHTLMIRRFR